jgi:hypothetical protein
MGGDYTPPIFFHAGLDKNPVLDIMTDRSVIMNIFWFFGI